MKNLALDTLLRGRLSTPLQPFACIDGDGGPCPFAVIASLRSRLPPSNGKLPFGGTISTGMPIAILR